MCSSFEQLVVQRQEGGVDGNSFFLQQQLQKLDIGEGQFRQCPCCFIEYPTNDFEGELCYPN